MLVLRQKVGFFPKIRGLGFFRSDTFLRRLLVLFTFMSFFLAAGVIFKEISNGSRASERASMLRQTKLSNLKQCKAKLS